MLNVKQNDNMNEIPNPTVLMNFDETGLLLNLLVKISSSYNIFLTEF